MSQAQPTMSPAERIRELSAINDHVPALLSSAGNAINSISNRPTKPTSVDGDQMDGIESEESLAAQKEAFTRHTTAYFTHIQSIMAHLRRQAYALEEAGVIAAEAPTLSTTGAAPEAAAQRPSGGAVMRRGSPAPQQRQVADEGDRITNGGLGNLDVGLLNSRGNSVGLDKEAELIAEVKQMLSAVLDKSSTEGAEM